MFFDQLDDVAGGLSQVHTIGLYPDSEFNISRDFVRIDVIGQREIEMLGEVVIEGYVSGRPWTHSGDQFSRRGLGSYRDPPAPGERGAAPALRGGGDFEFAGGEG